MHIIHNNPTKRKNLKYQITKFLIIAVICIEYTNQFLPSCPKGCKTCRRIKKPKKRILGQEKNNSSSKSQSLHPHPINPSNDNEKNLHPLVACLTCKETYRFIEKEKDCKPCKINNCAECNETALKCEKCSREYFKEISQKEIFCVSCPENCEKCSSPTTCSKCLLGYEFDHTAKLCVMSLKLILTLVGATLFFLAIGLIFYKLGKKRGWFKNGHEGENHAAHKEKMKKVMGRETVESRGGKRKGVDHDDHGNVLVSEEGRHDDIKEK